VTPLSAEELSEIRRLHVHLGRRIDSLLSGDYRSAVRGRGMEFEEVRTYVPGDDVRHIDWNVTARSGQPFVKVFREERQNTVLLVVDVSGSSRVGSGGRDGRTDRRLQIARIAGGLAYAGIRNRDRVGLVTFSDRVETYLSPRPTRSHVWAVIQAVFAAEGGHRDTEIAGALAFVHGVQRRRSVIVVVSDFLDEGPWPTALASLAGRHEVHAVLVHDPLDTGVGGLGLLELVDSETGDAFLADRTQMAAWRSPEARLRAAIAAGARGVAISTADDAWDVLHRHFQRLRVAR
jgi:uncharacterized protein (DUF58 family)